MPQPQFDSLVEQLGQVVGLLNDLELSVYRLGEQTPASPDRVRQCQQAAGSLLGALRAFLFQLDQDVLPRVDPRHDP